MDRESEIRRIIRTVLLGIAYYWGSPFYLSTNFEGPGHGESAFEKNFNRYRKKINLAISLEVSSIMRRIFPSKRGSIEIIPRPGILGTMINYMPFEICNALVNIE